MAKETPRTVKKNNSRSNEEKSNFAHAATFFCTFLSRCFARVQRETSRNFLAKSFMEEMSYLFLVHYFFFLCRSYSPWWPLAFLSFSPQLTRFLCCYSNKKRPLSFLPLALALCRFFLVELHWPVTYILFFSVFLFLRLYSKFVDMKHLI